MPNIQMHPIEGSSLIAAVGYDPETLRLRVKFKTNSKTYEYLGVPPDVFEGLVTAESTGKYFHANIGGRGKVQYEYKEVSE